MITNRELAVFLCLVAVCGYGLFRGVEILVRWLLPHIAWQ